MEIRQIGSFLAMNVRVYKIVNWMVLNLSKIGEIAQRVPETSLTSMFYQISPNKFNL